MDPHVIYLSASQPGWDQPSSWFPGSHEYSSEVLPAWQRRRRGADPGDAGAGDRCALTQARPDCVVSWEYGPATMRALAWTHRQRVPLLVFSELTPWSDRTLTTLQRRVHRMLAPRMDGFIVAGSQGVERLQGLGVAPTLVEVALQSADLDALGDPAAARRARAAGGPVRVLAVGRLVADKNLDVLIDAFAEAGFAEGEAELEIRGTGPLEPELRALALRLGVPVALPGPAALGELGEVYANADVLALVSSYEPFGVTLREGAAAGLPLIASRRAGAVGDVAVDGENAIVVDPDHRSEIADALRRMVREPDLRERLAAGSLAVTARHPLEADVEAWERAILRAVGGQTP